MTPPLDRAPPRPLVASPRAGVLLHLLHHLEVELHLPLHRLQPFLARRLDALERTPPPSADPQRTPRGLQRRLELREVDLLVADLALDDCAEPLVLRLDGGEAAGVALGALGVAKRLVPPLGALLPYIGNLDFDTKEDAVHLKNPREVYINIYKEAREKAKQAKKRAIEAYLEAKRIKQIYFLDEIDSSDSESEICNDIGEGLILGKQL